MHTLRRGYIRSDRRATCALQYLKSKRAVLRNLRHSKAVNLVEGNRGSCRRTGKQKKNGETVSKLKKITDK